MSATKGLTKISNTTNGLQKPGVNVLWSSNGLSKLSKARSSPNVSKINNLTTLKTSSKDSQEKTSPTSQCTKKQSPNASSRTNLSSKATNRGSPTTKPTQSHVTIVQISCGTPEVGTTNRQTLPNKTRSSQDGTKSTTSAKIAGAKTESKKKLKDTTSCTILEDRALLKKGLMTAPEKLPKKPDALRKKSLGRSTSMWNVPVDSETSKSSPKLSPEDPRRESTQKNTRNSLNRTTSLWNVPSDGSTGGRMSRTKSISGLRPSRIPLLTQHFGTQNVQGQSLADLSSVDRSVEKTRRKSRDLEEASRSMGEHIYENCREKTTPGKDAEKVLEVDPIYENLKDSGEKRDSELGSPTKEPDLAGPVPDDITDLEKRAEQLMAQLDDEEDKPSKVLDKDAEIEIQSLVTATRVLCHGYDDKDEVDFAKAERTPLKKVSDRESLQKSRSMAKSHESLLRREPELNIREIRNNWENQIKRSQETVGDARPKVEVGQTPKKRQEEKEPTKPAATLKRTKDIEHLVNFFNCKNTEISGAGVKETGSQDSWTRSKDSVPPKIKDSRKDDKSSGYASDGNSSEDSGHMSNENDNEWKDHEVIPTHREDLGSLKKSERFLKEIIEDLDNSLERTIEVFEATPIVQRFIPEEEKKSVEKSLSTSSGASSIDSWSEGRKIGRNERRKCSSGSKVKETSCAPGKETTSRQQIFFRSGALERLEAQRDEKLTGHIILLQARCRGYLARRKLNTLKLQDLAVRCIQRNVRKLMSVREWPWWRLYVKVAPLLNVHRTEDQLKARTEELEVLRAKVERLEQERNHLKHDNDKLEAKLSEMTADFAEEHSTSTLAAERIDAETSERIRLERELQDVTESNKNLQQTTERLEMELLYARAADLNGIASDGEDGEDGGVYKQRYEHAIRELEFTKRKMAQQHEDDLEQLVGLKKQLEKKLADAYEEVEEQRQVVGQWKRRVQKLNGEMHDLRLLLEEQTARNNLLEKKQRKFDSETQNLMDDLRQEKVQRERLAREKEIAIAEKFTVEQNLSDARLEIELKEERLHTLTQELEELTFGGKTEEEVAQLKKTKHELEKKMKDQEEELDDLAGQVQLLEQAKLRLEMSIEQQRKEMRKEMQQRDEELEDVRGNAHKKVKALEAQLETEHEERTILLREKHELERRLVAVEEQDRTERAAEAETVQRLKRDLKKTRALLRDAQTMLERSKGDSAGKAVLRQLKNQLEDAECARAAAVKAKQALEQDLNETQAAFEEASRLRSEAEERANAACRERAELRSQLEENEEELAEVLKKYRAAVQQVSAEQSQLQEAQVQISNLEAEKSSLKDQLSELSQRLESVEQLGDPTANSLATRRLEFRAKELESKLELEQTTRARLETQIARLKESLDKLQTENALLRTKEQTAQDAARRLQRSLRESRDEASSAAAREQEAVRARRDLEKTLEAAEAETKVARDDLRLALQRIDDLQSAIQGELDLDCSEEATTDNSDSD
ncbi:unconventional myosin-XVIIIa isoform X4 [Orussus abietinus]|uniref:unconventional myosin-XVIIIa isoform X4 n=1 Tax=Orussus abietinus TaxID=222816 RepID=UPI0006261EA7|nr:unconventional myosin-XVIIIa isoform X4 [Orussus abietinus]